MIVRLVIVPPLNNHPLVPARFMLPPARSRVPLIFTVPPLAARLPKAGAVKVPVRWSEALAREVDEAGVDEACGERAGARGEVEDFGIGEAMDGDGRIEGDGGSGTGEVGGRLRFEAL